MLLRPLLRIALTLGAAIALAGAALAQAARRDAIADWLRTAETATTPGSPGAAAKATPPDPREGDPQYEQARALMVAIDAILKDAADTRSGATKLPSRDDFILPPMWTETREDRNQKVRACSTARSPSSPTCPWSRCRRRSRGSARNIREIEDQNATLKEKQLIAPKDAAFPAI